MPSSSAALDRMVALMEDYDQFREADAVFHRTVMDMSENFLASNIAYTLYSRARSFARFEGDPPSDAIDRTVESTARSTRPSPPEKVGRGSARHGRSHRRLPGNVATRPASPDPPGLLAPS